MGGESSPSPLLLRGCRCGARPIARRRTLAARPSECPHRLGGDDRVQWASGSPGCSRDAPGGATRPSTPTGSGAPCDAAVRAKPRRHRCSAGRSPRHPGALRRSGAFGRAPRRFPSSSERKPERRQGGPACAASAPFRTGVTEASGFASDRCAWPARRPRAAFEQRLEPRPGAILAPGRGSRALSRACGRAAGRGDRSRRPRRG
jgi:hypothetical protein